MNLTEIEIRHILYLLEHDKKETYSYFKRYRKRAARIEAKLKAELAYIKEIKKEAKI